MTKQATGYMQHIIAGIRITGPQPARISTHGGGTGADGSYVTATFGQQLMITMYDVAAVRVYAEAWTAEEHQWIFEHLPTATATTGQSANAGPALSVRAAGTHRSFVRYDQATRAALIRVGSLTWHVLDQAAAYSMQDAWRYLAEVAPVVLSRQAPITHR